MLQFSEDKAIERPTFPPPPTIDPMGIGVEGKKIFFSFSLLGLVHGHSDIAVHSATKAVMAQKRSFFWIFFNFF